MKRLVVVLSFLMLFASCGTFIPPQDRTVIRIKGSDTMVYLVQRWAEQFMLLNPDISIYTYGGGSATGIDALIAGTVDIAAASRPMQSDEIKKLAERKSSIGISVLTGKDGLSIYLHPDNPVKSLTLDQLKNIFTGAIADWSEVGGFHAPIHVYSREPSSGTFLFFEEHVLFGSPYAKQRIAVATTSQMTSAVESDSLGIGYGGVAYGTNVIHLRINGVAPTPANIKNGTYPISRYLYLYTAEPPSGNIKKFIDWVISDEGQKIVEVMGYIPLYR
ncbi:MAG: phosphate ABC transporter substrate-binding protein [Bacteroidota bacterium]